MKPLREYQSFAIDSLREAIREGKRPVLAAPCGAGKTLLAATIFSMARAKNKRVCFVVPYLSLLSQTYRAFIEAGMSEEEISVIQGSNPLQDWSREIQIASVCTLARRPKLPQADIVIFDEVHINSKVYERWMVTSPDTVFIGLSATPFTKGMDKLWNKLINVSTISKLIEEGYLSPFKYFAPAQPDLSGIKIIRGDYQVDQLADRMSNKELVADVVTTWIKRGEWRPTICFAVNRKHAKELEAQFELANIPAAYVDAFTDVKEREELLEKLKRGEIKVICNVGVFSTGLDAPFISCLILARPTKSPALFIQIFGRILRKSQGKDNAIVLDHSNTALDLGRPDEIHYDDFVSGEKSISAKLEKQMKEKKPRLCPSCQAVVTPKTQVCECGFHFKPAPSDIYVSDGDLSELGSKGKIGKATRDEKQIWYSGLLWIAKERGYSRGFAAHKYRERFGCWPKGLHEVEEYPTQTVFNYIKSKNIAYAKAKAKNIMGK
jgi:superfamily II DNA or RNA helicase